jgi:hypothetical protein
MHSSTDKGKPIAVFARCAWDTAGAAEGPLGINLHDSWSVTRTEDFYAKQMRPGFNPGAVCVGFVMEKVALGPSTLGFPSVGDFTRVP